MYKLYPLWPFCKKSLGINMLDMCDLIGKIISLLKKKKQKQHRLCQNRCCYVPYNIGFVKTDVVMHLTTSIFLKIDIVFCSPTSVFRKTDVGLYICYFFRYFLLYNIGFHWFFKKSMLCSLASHRFSKIDINIDTFKISSFNVG